MNEKVKLVKTMRGLTASIEATLVRLTPRQAHLRLPGGATRAFWLKNGQRVGGDDPVVSSFRIAPEDLERLRTEAEKVKK